LLKSWRRTLVFIVVAAFMAGIMFTGGCYLVKDMFPQKDNSGSGGLANAELLSGVGSGTIADVVAKASPAVVKISTTVSSSGNTDPFFNDPFFRQFFGTPFVPKQQQQEEGLGSGFIISKDGYILTNEHVIDQADEITVTIIGFDQELKATVVGADYDLDLALLKVDVEKELPFLELGDSDQIRVGNWVIAIGNPYGLDHTVTTGVISAKGRPINVQDRQYENLLQTDASINPGNSGGPLLNLMGEVVGINTAINAQAQGIGFAIPTSTVKRVLEDLKNNVNNVRPWIGVQIRSIDENIAHYLGLYKAEGALVVGVVPDGPAEKAGLEQWDVIVEFNGKEIKDADELVEVINSVKIGDKVKALIVRDRQVVAVNIVVAEKPKNIR